MFVTNKIDSSEAPRPSELISNERAAFPAFPRTKIHQFLEGSQKNSEIILKISSQLEKDPVLQSSFGEYDMLTTQQRELTALRIDRLTNYRELESIDDFFTRLNLITIYDPSLGIRISINLGLFLNCIKGNGTASQVEYWCNRKEALILKQIYGCFAMTELGHGSNVSGCETTATFDQETDEFIINTPHIGATKWWIGGAAHSATHSVVYARLLVHGKDYGVKTFIVPLRDSNHKLMPGVAIGDIGGKMGRSGVDNGWIQYSDVRIPRFFMLQKWCKVDRNGQVILPPLEQMSYISLLGGRVFMAVDSYRICARFITIATRYGVGRRQFKTDGDVESQLLDYPLHQRRLMPFLALTYMMGVGTRRLMDSHKSIVELLDQAVAKNDKAGIITGLNDTKSLFNDSGSLKATLTWFAADCIDQCRQACGGHGYSAYNGFGKSYDDWVVQCTWEGDNNVLSMSCGKTILNNMKLVLKGKKITGTMDFLNSTKLAESTAILDSLDSLTAENVLILVQLLIIRVAIQTLEQMDNQKLKMDDVSYNRVVLSKLRCHHYLLQTFIQKLQQADSEITDVLSLVMRVYFLVYIIEDYSSLLLEHELITPSLKSKVSMKLVPQLLQEMRQKSIVLTDSFLQPDNLLHSSIGKYNGDIYENYFNVVNQQNDAFNTKAPYSEKFEAMLNRDSLEARERYEKKEADV